MTTRPAKALQRPLLITLGTTALVTALSKLPDSISATAVGFGFLAVTYWLVLRSDDPEHIAHYGLSLAGLFEPARLSAVRTAPSVSWRRM